MERHVTQAVEARRSGRQTVRKVGFVGVTGRVSIGSLIDASGAVNVDDIAEVFSMSKAQLADTAGLAREVFQKSARLHQRLGRATAESRNRLGAIPGHCLRRATSPRLDKIDDLEHLTHPALGLGPTSPEVNCQRLRAPPCLLPGLFQLPDYRRSGGHGARQICGIVQ